MTLLKDHLKTSPNPELGIQAFAADVAARYPQKPSNTWGHAREAACHWVIEYQSKADNTVTILMLPLMLLGHFHYRRSRLTFTTYHYLSPFQARSLRLTLALKKFFLPMIVLALLTSGIALVIALIMIAVVVFTPPSPAGKAHPEYIALAVLVIVSIFVAALKAQRWFWKRGIPPGND